MSVKLSPKSPVNVEEIEIRDFSSDGRPFHSPLPLSFNDISSRKRPPKEKKEGRVEQLTKKEAKIVVST